MSNEIEEFCEIIAEGGVIIAPPSLAAKLIAAGTDPKYVRSSVFAPPGTIFALAKEYADKNFPELPPSRHQRDDP